MLGGATYVSYNIHKINMFREKWAENKVVI